MGTDDYEQFMPGDKLFLDVDAMGDDEDPLGQVGASQADLPDPRHAQPAWKQCWRKALAKARVKLADKSWKDKSWKDKPDKVAMMDAIAAFADSYPVKVRKVKHVVPSEDTRRLRQLQAADPTRR